MLYVVEILRRHDELSTIMGRVREWLDAQRFEPNAFRCSTDEAIVTCRLEFEFENEAIASSANKIRTTSTRRFPRSMSKFTGTQLW